MKRSLVVQAALLWLLGACWWGWASPGWLLASAAGLALNVLVVTRMTRPPEPTAPPSEDTGRFLATLSHELRTPLTSVVAYANLLADEVKGPLTAEQKQLVEKVLKNADHLLYLIHDLLDIARIDAGRLEMTLTLVSLEECLESAYAAVEPQLKEKGLNFSVEVPDATILVSGNFHRLQQVFVNLLGNAAKFTDGGGEVGVRAVVDGAWVEVTVWDSGIGIAPESLAHIFEEFRQGDEGVRRRFGGTGLGLSICRKLLELHRGTIRAQAREPQGSTFIVRLPLAPPAPPKRQEISKLLRI